MKFPRLYKKTSHGTIEQWEIESIDWDGVGLVRTRFGLVGGKIQETEDVIRKGKNIGRSNETTAVQQAEAEAKAKWEKQLKKGYCQTQEAAEAGETDDIIEGGIAPMLAHSFDKHGHKIVWPAYISRKLDGIRCIAQIRDGKATLWTRTRKPIRSMPHIIKTLESLEWKSDVDLDGELYHPDYKDDFNKIISLVRPDDPVEGHEIVQYHVFDAIFNNDEKEDFEIRVDALKHMTMPVPVVLVEQVVVNNADEAMAKTVEFVAEGYEGGMVKNCLGPYEHKRSYLIQKIKFMKEEDFEIVGAEEGRGKLAGHVGSFVCKTSDGQTFNVKLKGSLENLSHLWRHPYEWRGKLMSVQFQNLTPDGLPRFPVGKAIRNYE